MFKTNCFIIDAFSLPKRLFNMLQMLRRVHLLVAIVVGGRNFFCGDTWVTSSGFDRCTAYQIGMRATVMNSILLQSALEKLGCGLECRVHFLCQRLLSPTTDNRPFGILRREEF